MNVEKTKLMRISIVAIEGGKETEGV